MSTLGQVTSRILDDTNNPSLTSQAVQQVQLAINHYKTTPFWFNETMTTLSASLAYIAVPSDYLLDNALYVIQSGYAVPMNKAATAQDVISMRPSTGGRPDSYAYYQNRLEFDRSCDSVYTLHLYYIKELTVVSAAADTNTWLTDGEDLITYRAEKVIFANIIRDREAAKVAASLEAEAYASLLRNRDQRIGTGHAVPHYP